MPFSTPLQETLQEQPTAFGFWLTYPSAAVAKTVLRSATTDPAKGYSWVLIDAEHGLITDREYYELANAVASEGASPIIRVPWSEEWMIKRALDAGPHGIVTPMCHIPEDAQRIVKYSKYPPTGTRGYGPMFAAHTLPQTVVGAAYDDHADQSLLVVVQIESRSGVDHVEEIAKVEGVDVIFIGPFDLAKSMGVTRGGEEHEAAIQRILKAAKEAGKKSAIFCTDGESARTRAEQGFNMVSVTTDVGALGNIMKSELEVATGGSKGDPGARSGY